MECFTNEFEGHGTSSEPMMSTVDWGPVVEQWKEILNVISFNLSKISSKIKNDFEVWCFYSFTSSIWASIPPLILPSTTGTSPHPFQSNSSISTPLVLKYQHFINYIYQIWFFFTNFSRLFEQTGSMSNVYTGVPIGHKFTLPYSSQ